MNLEKITNGAKTTNIINNGEYDKAHNTLLQIEQKSEYHKEKINNILNKSISLINDFLKYIDSKLDEHFFDKYKYHESGKIPPGLSEMWDKYSNERR
jgi:hypothetical protein